MSVNDQWEAAEAERAKIEAFESTYWVKTGRKHFAWLPVKTDEGIRWLTEVWQQTETLPPSYEIVTGKKVDPKITYFTLVGMQKKRLLGDY